MTLIIHGSNMSWRFHAGQITPMKVERIMLGITLSWYIWCAIWPPRNVLELTKLPNFRMTVGVALFEVCLSDCSLETGKCLLKECQHFYPVSFKQTYIIAARLKGQLFWYPRISFLRLSVGSFLFLFFVFYLPTHRWGTTPESPCHMPCNSLPLHLCVFFGQTFADSFVTEVDMKSIDSLREMKDKLQTALKAQRRKQFRMGRTKKTLNKAKPNRLYII